MQVMKGHHYIMLDDAPATSIEDVCEAVGAGRLLGQRVHDRVVQLPRGERNVDVGAVFEVVPRESAASLNLDA
jgi:hypothetical protein